MRIQIGAHFKFSNSCFLLEFSRRSIKAWMTYTLQTMYFKPYNRNTVAKLICIAYGPR